jgi:hypothetical protein
MKTVALEGAKSAKEKPIQRWRSSVFDIAEAWRSNLLWRDDYVFWTARGLSKTGTLQPHDEVLLELPKFLSRDEVLWLFSQLQQSLRPTLEWRGEFLALFPQVSLADLPPPLYDEEAAMREAKVAYEQALRERAEYERLHGNWPGPDDPIPF